MKTMKKKGILRIGLWICAAVCTLCLSFMGWDSRVAYAAENTASINLHIGDTIEAKDYKINSADVYAEGMKIVYPDGGIYSSDKLLIEQAGRYQVTYYATVGGQRVEETKNYIAIRRPQDMIIAEAGMQVEYGKFYVGESPYELTKETCGAKVRFKAGQSITFAVNLKTADLTAGNNFLEMIVEPSVYGETDFEKLTVRLTDTADENNFVEYIIESSNLIDGAGMLSYVKAGANGRQYGGYEGSKFHMRTYGTPAFHSFRGWSRIGEDFANKTVSENVLTLAIDHEERQLFCGPSSNQSKRNKLVNDLDAPAQYKSDAWEGFKGDEVSVTVKAENFSKSEGVLLIKSFGGYDLSKDVVDNDAPVIFFDYDMSDSLPVAQVGTRFSMLPFTATDSLDKAVNTRVWVNYIDGNGEKITVEHDGEAFFVEYTGRYEVIYFAEDYSGNQAEERIEIVALEAAPNIYIGIEEPLIEVDVYETVSIPFVSDIAIYGGSGTLKTERAVYSPAKKLLNVKDTLQLTELGDYKVVYSAEDYYGRVSYGVVTVRAKEIDAPRFVKTPQFADVLLKGFTYEFPTALAIETVGGEILALPCKTYVNDMLVEGSFTAAGEEVAIRYVAEGATGLAEWENVFSVVDAERGKYKSRYFYTEDELQLIDQKTYLEFSFSDNAETTFVNSISSENLSVSLLYEAERTNFSEMSFIVTDAMDESLSVTFRFFYDKVGGKWSMQLNDGFGAFAYAESKGMLSFNYSAKDRKVIDTSGEAVGIVTVYDNGEEFKGFSDSVYFEIAFTGVSEQSSIYLTQLCNQAMGYNKSSIEKASDETKPLIVLDEAFLLRQKLGSTANIPTAKAFDVLGQIVEFNVSVEMNGQVIASGAADKKLEFVLDKAGYYNVTYFAKDTNNNMMSLPYMIMVVDETAPTLTVKDSLKDRYKVGDKVAIPEYAATDNGGKCYIQVMVILPDDEMRLLHYGKNGEVTSLLSKDSHVYDSNFKAGDNAFITQKKGRYVLRVIAYDDYYNYTYKEIEFWVK